ncbi:MAG: hypothetical protein Q8P42_05505 [Gallionella sp.]|nr:hypothetical protein [Gallionella sp.]
MKNKGWFTSWMFGMVVVSIFIAGCGNSDVSANTPAQPAASSLPVKATAKVDGYKEFKFGMTASQILRLDACAEEYDKLIAEVKRYVATGEEVIAENKVRTDPQPLEDNYWVSMLDENRAVLSKLENHDETLSLDLLTKGISVDRDLRHNTCMVEMFGEPHSPSFGFENGKLTSVHFTVGTFNNEKYQALHKGLSEKYGSVTVPTAEQIGSFNNKTLNTVSATYAFNQVRLSIAYTLYGKMISIDYFSPDKAQEVAKESAVGQVKTGDL